MAPTPPSSTYALVTGASKGIGRAFADACAAEGRNLALVALPGESLAEVSAEITQRFNVQVRYLETDLSKPDSAQQVFDWCQSEHLTVDYLINNAGFGTVGPVADANLPQHLVMLQLNMVTPYILIKLFTPQLLQQPSANILNVGSQAALLPVPYKGTYSATKAFVYYLSMTMAYEQQGSNLHVGCVLPSGVPTNAAVRSRIKSAGFFGRLSMMEADELARYALKCMRRKKRMIIPGAINRFAYYLGGLLPLSLNMHFAATQIKKDMKK